MGYTEGGRVKRTREVEAAFAAGRVVVKGTAGNQVKLPAAANLGVLGVAETKGDPADDKYKFATIVEAGEADVISGGAFNPGDLLRSDASGKLVKVGGEAVGALVYVIGRAVEAAAGADEEKAALIQQFVLKDQVSASVKIPGTEAAAAANYGVFFVADAAMEIIEAVERHETAGSDAGAVTLMVAKVPSGTAKGAGTDMLAAGLDLKATADTNQVGTLHATQANRQLAAGDAVACVPTGTLTAVAGLAARLTFRLL